MKALLMSGIFCCGLLHILQGQSLIIKGRIRCLNQTANSTKGAENIVVVPAYKPALSTITATRPSGYFEVNTGAPISRLQDKQVTIYVISRCSNCAQMAKRVFISEDQDRRNKNDQKQYVTVKDWMLNSNCEQAELVPLAADSVLRMVVQQPEQNLDKVSSATALLGAPPLLNFITNLVAVVGTTGFPQGDFSATSLAAGKINYGRLLLASPMFHSANTGFNFSPGRDLSEAVFWNPSATAFANNNGNISLLTNFKNNVKLAGFYKLNKKLILGAGGIYTMQDEFRSTTFTQTVFSRVEDSIKMNLNEYAAFLSPAYQINEKLSVAVSLKSIWQDFTIPDMVTVNPQGKGTFKNKTITEQHFDADVSATFKATPSFQIGLNLMNLAGTALYADAFVQGQATVPVQNQRSAGLGLLYKNQRFNVGTDLLFTEDGFFDASLGVNYVPFNNALISAGLAFKQLSYSLAFRMKYFRVSYINDNDFFVNEKRKAESSFLNGRIHGGFVFDIK